MSVICTTFVEKFILITHHSCFFISIVCHYKIQCCKLKISIIFAYVIIYLK